MKTFLALYSLTVALALGQQPTEIPSFLEQAALKHGEFGKRAASFLVEHMPAKDRENLKAEFLMENLTLASRAREEFPWGKGVPEDIFLNDVLPYASLDETREAWRHDLLEKAKLLVGEAKTASDAVQAINRDLFQLINVHYNTGRKRPNQSPSESVAQGRATCTGLSIILVDACRAVGIPARVVGTPLWTNKRGNHTWVEIWDGEWKFTGADEFDAKGLNRGWFVGDASKAVSDPPEHAIYATSWRSTGKYFPMVWNRRSKEVPGLDVTSRYATTVSTSPAESVVHLRAWDRQGGERIVVEAELLGADGAVLDKVTTKAGQADLNDMASVKLQNGRDYTLRLNYGGEQRSLPLKVEKGGESTRELDWASLAPKPKIDPLLLTEAWLKLPSAKRPAAPRVMLSKEQAATARATLWESRRKELAKDRRAEMEAKAIAIGDKTLRFEERVFGEARDGQRSLWISLHGGGNAPPQVNDRQWQNQIKLYEPKEGIYVAPRAPTNTWNLWHEGHIDALFDRLIENYVALRGVNPDRVYLLGYSAGGDGVFQLAPRFADRLAAASMMAGHPNDASPLGLRNLPFAIFMGGKDAAYKRNEIAAEWGHKLDELQKADPQGYPHKLTIYEGLGHWMERKDAEAIPWMAGQSRNLWPKKVVWRQSSRTHDRFYWLAVPKELAAKGQIVRGEVDGQSIHITTEGISKVETRLSDELLDLDQPIKITLNGQIAFQGKVERKFSDLANTVAERPGIRGAASAVLVLGQ